MRLGRLGRVEVEPRDQPQHLEHLEPRDQPQHRRAAGGDRDADQVEGGREGREEESGRQGGRTQFC